KITKLLLDKVDKEQWQQAIEIENILQKRSPVAAKRQARLIKKRLLTMTPELWAMIADGSAEIAVQALFAAAIKDSRLLGDFMLKIVHERWRMFERRLSLSDWNDYIEMCAQIDPGIMKWSEPTQKKVRQVVFRILAEAGYIDSTKTLNMLPAIIHPKIETYLHSHNEEYILQCMQATQ
ncbi:MAG: DUF1819 family protein, partial [Thermodesulfobacteriota bacterium]|nr:DUF1819 family protein [Thermodesulfobacteriota bacterium]